MSRKIVLVTSAHSPFDDRIFHHFAKTFYRNGDSVSIICSTKDVNTEIEGIKIIGFNSDNISQNEKIQKLISLLAFEKPNITICSEPLTILAVHRYRKKHHKTAKIIFDITEWYPSKTNLIGTKGVARLSKALKLLLFNIYASYICDGFIFGEFYKSIPYKYIFPFKRGPIVSYFPDLDFINHTHNAISNNEITLCFTGKLCEEKGFRHFLKVASLLTMQRPELKITLKIIGYFAYKDDENFYSQFQIDCPNIICEKYEFLPFEKFLEKISDVHIFFDLREMDFQNHHCLPIKLFYYMACGRPVIYSDLKAISKELDISPFGYLVNPNAYKDIVEIIAAYKDNPNLYATHCYNARNMAEKYYNWASIESLLLSYISKF